MKKAFTFACAALMAGSVSYGQEAFKHLGLSLEVGTTGAGVNLSYPLVTNHLILSLGYNFPALTIKKNAELTTGYVNGKVNEVNTMINNYNRYAGMFAEQFAAWGLDQNMASIAAIESMNADFEATLNFANYKVMLEYYPTIQSNFHFTVGMMYGDGEWMNFSATVDRNAWNTYNAAVAANDAATANVNKYNERIAQLLPDDPSKQLKLAHIDDAARITLNDQTFCIDKQSDGRFDAKMTIRKMKPYVGIGFGNSVPTKHRCGFQLEIGAYYQGKAVIESDQEVEYDSSAYSDRTIDNLVDAVTRVQWYPQVSFRWTGRLF